MSTLQQLEESDWGDPNPDDTLMIQRCMQLRRTPISELSPEDLRLLIGQQIGNDHLIPIAISVVERAPLTGGDMFEGALVENIARADPTWWSSNPAEKERFRAVVEPLVQSSDLDSDVAAVINSWLDTHTPTSS